MDINKIVSLQNTSSKATVQCRNTEKEVIYQLNKWLFFLWGRKKYNFRFRIPTCSFFNDDAGTKKGRLPAQSDDGSGYNQETDYCQCFGKILPCRVALFENKVVSLFTLMMYGCDTDIYFKFRLGCQLEILWLEKNIRFLHDSFQHW